MSDRLAAFEADGYQFRIEGEHLAVQATKELMSPVAVDLLRRCKSELMDELRLRNFCGLVRAFGTEYGVLLDDDEITAQLDERDIEYLRDIDREELQCWAGLLAYRLTERPPCSDVNGESYLKLQNGNR